MKPLLSLIAVTLITIGSAQAADEFLGPWASGATEVLKITKDGDALRAEFIRENVKYEFEKVGYPAAVVDGALVISGDQGNVSAKYDEVRKVLILGGMKAFEKLSPEKAEALIAQLEKK